LLSRHRGTDGGEWMPRKVLDIGAGVGSASAAAMRVFDGVEWVHAVDPSRSMRDVCESVLQEISQERNQNVRITSGESILEGEDSGSASFDLVTCCYTMQEIPNPKSILSLAAVLWDKLAPNGIFILVEPGTPDGFDNIRSIREMLLECAPEEAHVVAPCTHNGRCPMQRHIKNFNAEKKVDNYSFDDDGNIVTNGYNEDALDDDRDTHDDKPFKFDYELDPLDHINALPRKPSDVDSRGTSHPFENAYCSFVHRLPGAGSDHSGSKFASSRKGEKLSYLVVQKRVRTHTPSHKKETDDDPWQHINIVEIMAESIKSKLSSHEIYQPNQQHFERDKAIDEKITRVHHQYKSSDAANNPLGLEAVRGSNQNSWGRLIRAPLKKKGHIIVDYCSEGSNGDGRLVRNIICKRIENVLPGMFHAARKSRWGGVWPDLIGHLTGRNEKKEEGDL